MNENRELFESVPIPRAVASLAIPTIIGMLVTMAYNLADTFFVGLTNDPDAVAAVTLAYPSLMVSKALASMFGIGGGSLISRCLGVGDYERAKRTSACCVCGAAAAGFILSLLVLLFRAPLALMLGADADTLGPTSDYLFWVSAIGGVPTVLSMALAFLVRSEGAAKQASFGTSLGGLLNIALDPLFMFVLLPEGMAVIGAAAATMVSNCVSTTYFLIYLRRKRATSVISLRPSDLRPDRAIVRGVMVIGLPAALQILLSVASNTVLNNLTGKTAELILPETSSQAVAALGITKKLDMLPMDITIGLAQGVLPLLGYNYSAGNRERLNSAERFSLTLAVSFSLVCVAVFEPLAPQLVGLFIDDAQTVAYGAAFLRRLCVTTPFMAVGYLLISMFQAVGKGKQALALSCARKGVVDIPVMFLMNSLLPLYGLVWTQPIVDLLSTALALTLYARFKRQTVSAGESSAG